MNGKSSSKKTPKGKPVHHFKAGDEDISSRPLILAFGEQINANTAERLMDVPLTPGNVSSKCALFENHKRASDDTDYQSAMSEKSRQEGEYDMPDVYGTYQNTKYALSRSSTVEQFQPQTQTHNPRTYPSVSGPANVDNRVRATAAVADDQRALEQMRLQHAQLLQQTRELQAQQDAAALAAARQAEMAQLAQSIAFLQNQNKQLQLGNQVKEQQKYLLIKQQQDEIEQLKLELQQQRVVQQQQLLSSTIPGSKTTQIADEHIYRAGSTVHAHQFAPTASSNSVPIASRDDDLRQLLAKLVEEVSSLKMNQNRTPIAVNQELQHVASPQPQQLYASQAPQASAQPLQYQHQHQPQPQQLYYTPQASALPQKQPQPQQQPLPKTPSKPPSLDTTTPKPQTQKPLCDLIVADCILDRAGSVTVYQLPLTRSKSVAGCSKYEVSAGKSLVMRGYVTRTIIIVGATGAGKTTLINGMVNFIFGVQWQHQYRLRLVAESAAQSQAHSQTQIISAYHIPQYKGSPVPYALTIVDTPGFGDTRGIKKDKEITDMMRQFFQSPDGVSEVNCVGFVTQASLPRLTPSQKYIFDSILATFGRDIIENIMLLVTFADAQDPPVLAGVREAMIPFRNFNKFNNSALYVVPQATNANVLDFNAMIWTLGNANFIDFFAWLQGATTKSLVLTKQVLEERRRLETVLNGLLPQVTAALNQMEEQRKLIACLEQHRIEIEANADFKITICVTKQRKVDLTTGVYITNCLECNYTCRDHYSYANDNDKHKCAAMANQGDETLAHCKVCPGKCFWSKHVNNPYKFELYTEDEVRTSDEMMSKYQSASQAKLNVEQVIEQMTLEFTEIKKNLFKMILEARNCLLKLNQIAMKRNPLTMVDYLEQLIEAEKHEMKPGFKDRLNALHDTKKEAEILEKIAKSGQTVEEILESFMQSAGCVNTAV